MAEKTMWRACRGPFYVSDDAQDLINPADVSGFLIAEGAELDMAPDFFLITHWRMGYKEAKKHLASVAYDISDSGAYELPSVLAAALWHSVLNRMSENRATEEFERFPMEVQLAILDSLQWIAAQDLTKEADEVFLLVPTGAAPAQIEEFRRNFSFDRVARKTYLKSTQDVIDYLSEEYGADCA